jgi:hypothetical protein
MSDDNLNDISSKEPAEGSREVIDRELARQNQKQKQEPRKEGKLDPAVRISE